MDKEKLKEKIGRIPVPLLFLVLALYLGYTWYSFHSAADSPMLMKESELQEVKKQTETLAAKAKELEAFKATLETKRSELRQLASKLDDMKGTLSDSMDVPGFMQLTVNEARKVGLTVVSIKPGERKAKEFYAEQAFDFAFRGVYVQLMVFMHRLAQLQTIVKAENFTVKPASSRQTGYVMLEGSIQLKSYSYLRSKADELLKAQEAASEAAAAGNKPATPGGGK